MSDQLFSETLLQYINATTDTQWKKINPDYTHYFASASLDAALSDLESQLGAQTPTQPTTHAEQRTLSQWIGSVTLSQLQSRINAMNSQYQQLAASKRASDTLSAWAYSVAVGNRNNDITFLGVYLYGLGIADGLYVENPTGGS